MKGVDKMVAGEVRVRSGFAVLCVSLVLCAAGALAGEGKPLQRHHGIEPEPLPSIDSAAAEFSKGIPSAQPDSRASWLLGKIEPALAERSMTGTDLDVIIYLRALPGTPSIEQIKLPHRITIEELARRVREIERAYRPDRSLTREEERVVVPWLAAGMSPDDRSRRRALNSEVDHRLSVMRADVQETLEQRAAGPQQEISEVIRSSGGQVRSRILLTNAVAATIPGESLLGIASHPLVVEVVRSPEWRDELDVSIPSAGITTWHGVSIDGGTFDVGVVDSGLQSDHPAFSGIEFHTDGSPLTDVGTHGTHVTGIIASADGSYKGAAHGLDKVFFGHRDDDFAAFEGLMNTSTTLDTPDVINFSQGGDVATDTDYSANDAFFDAFVESYDVMITNSAGNGGWGSTTITHPAPAYNLLVVANMEDRNTTDRADDYRRASSSVGPTLDGRKKPDLAAPGTNIVATNSRWDGADTCGVVSCGSTTSEDPCHDDFCSLTGTSMAAPHIAGAIVLMEDGGNIDPLAQKAVLINTADTWTSANTETKNDDGPVSGSSWDKSYGWGYVDMTKAYFNRTDYFADSLVPNNGNATEDDYKLYRGTFLADDKATLVWAKRGVYEVGEISTRYDLSDIDLILYDESDGATVDSDIGAADNVHQVAASSSVSGVVKVYAQSGSFEGAISEPFALATEEGFTAVDFPATFSVDGDWPDTMAPGSQADFQAWVDNTGEIASHDNALELQPLPNGWSLVSGAELQAVGSAPADGSSPAAQWRLQVRAADTSAPTPDPMSFAVAPFELGTSQIQMSATVGSDPHGPVEYEVDFTSSPTGGAGGSDGTWSTSTLHVDSGLETNHQYCYRVRARDALPVTEQPLLTHEHSSYGETYGPAGPFGLPVTLDETPNVGSYSATDCAFTAANAPIPAALSNVGDDGIQASWAANGNPAGTEYLVENVTLGTDSGWITQTSWVSAGLVCGDSYTFRVRARSGDQVETSVALLGSRVAGVDSDGDAIPDCVDPDDDNDGVSDDGDCAPFDPAFWEVPGEVTDLLLAKNGTTAILDWIAPGSPGGTVVLFDTLRSSLPDDFVGPGDCIEIDGLDTAAAHADLPAGGQTFFYLIRAGNSCGEGTPGAGSGGVPRIALSCP